MVVVTLRADIMRTLQIFENFAGYFKIIHPITFKFLDGFVCPQLKTDMLELFLDILCIRSYENITKYIIHTVTKQDIIGRVSYRL